MPRLVINLLGPLQVGLDGRPVIAFATEKTRALLVYLAVESAQPLRREYLAALFWPDQPEERARHNLRQALSSLRQAIGDSDGSSKPFLLVERETLQFDLQSATALDVAEFVTLAGELRSHRHHEPARCLPCIRRMQRMAELYRGDFLADFLVSDSELYEEWVLLKREWMRRLASEAFAMLADYSERRGELALARDYARRLVEVEPWHEEAHRQLMRLLWAEGKRSAAMAQYEACRRILETEFAAKPTVETQQLFERIKAEEPDSVQGGSRNRNEPPVVPLLPQPTTPFWGREIELAELSEMLANPDCRMITLTGPGGIGKSRLALKVAEDQRGLFADGVAFVALASVADSDWIALSIADALQLPVAPGNAARRLLNQLRGKELLLVLDNFEHLLDCCGVLSELLHVARNLKILVTSQERLCLREEWLYPLSGLTYPDHAMGSQAPEAYGALALFQQRARQVQPRFSLNVSVLPSIIRICQMVEGLPLGVELAAAAVGEQTCSEIAVALERTFDALESPLRDIPTRHRSLRAVFEHAWALMTINEQQCFEALAVFVGSFECEAASAVAGASQTVLTALIAKSLLAFDGTRYLWHGVTRQYALERLAVSARAEALHDQHCTFFSSRVRDGLASLDGAQGLTALAAWESDRANIKAAWSWAVSRCYLVHLAEMVQGVGKFYRLRGPVQEGLQLLAQALDLLAVDQMPSLEVLLRAEQVQLLCLQLRFDEGLESAERLIVLGQRLTSPLAEGRGYFLKGKTLQQQSKFDLAEQALGLGLECLALLPVTEVNVARLNANLYRELGNIATRRGALDTAQEYYQAALDLYNTLEDRSGKSAILNNLGSLAYDCGEYDFAQSKFTAALALYRELGNRPGEARALNNLANVAADCRDYGTALRCYREALQIHRTLENQPAHSAALNNLGALYWELGLYVEAREAYRQALAMFQESGNSQAEGECLANLCLLELYTGNLQAGLRLGRQAADISQRSDDVFTLANASTYLGKIYAELGQYDDAETWYQKARAIRSGAPHAGRLLELDAELTALIWQRGDPVRALAEIAPVLEALQTDNALEGAEEPYHVYWICYQILMANADQRAAAILARAREQLLEQAERIPEPELRHSFLENILTHRRIMEG
ncbi:MAG: tetratricopeptide repeat protein [Anaerolineae bacterium]|nr:tetratricopeptide repeat protein [Anaerolineae bacterium]